MPRPFVIFASRYLACCLDSVRRGLIPTFSGLRDPKGSIVPFPNYPQVCPAHRSAVRLMSHTSIDLQGLSSPMRELGQRELALNQGETLTPQYTHQQLAILSRGAGLYPIALDGSCQIS